jgi:hypothetical protein
MVFFFRNMPDVRNGLGINGFRGVGRRIKTKNMIPHKASEDGAAAGHCRSSPGVHVENIYSHFRKFLQPPLRSNAPHGFSIGSKSAAVHPSKSGLLVQQKFRAHQ